jgi:hypothetical protein
MTNKRQYRNNHSIAETHNIVDAKSAQMYADALLAATKDDKTSVMFNSSGFVTPSHLDNHSIENLVRMTASIINSLALRIGTSNDSDEATKALSIISNYAMGAATIQQNARDDRLVRQAEEILKARVKANTNA